MISVRYLFFFYLIFSSACQHNAKPEIVVLISANAEWNVIKELYPNEVYNETVWGEYFVQNISTSKTNKSVIFFHEGWGKVAAAGATQYAIDQWDPVVLINLGTCGGFAGLVYKYEILLVDQTIIYDIKEAMGDSQSAIREYTTQLDLSWINFPDSIRKTVLVSADRDLVPEEIEMLKQKYHGIAGDWETGAIAYTCNRNNKKILILRGVTDLVDATAGEAFGNPGVFTDNTRVVMQKLVEDLPFWIEAIQFNQLSQSK